MFVDVVCKSMAEGSGFGRFPAVTERYCGAKSAAVSVSSVSIFAVTRFT